jgi:hypothetical protein
VRYFLIFRTEIGWAGKNRKEIELSIQKTKNGILPTRYSGLKTAFRLRFQTGGWGSKQPVFDPLIGFAIVFRA